MNGFRTAAIATFLIAIGGAAGAGVLDIPAAASALPLPAEGVTLLTGIAGLGFLRRRGRV